MNFIKKNAFFFLLAFGTLNLFGQSENIKFNDVCGLLETKNFFKAKQVYELQKNGLSLAHQKFIEAVLFNAFNEIDKSRDEITFLSNKKG